MGGNPTERALSASRLAEMGFCERWVVLEQRHGRRRLRQPLHEERGQRSLRRKLRESLLAWQMARTFSKDEILALYLNQTFYGGFAYGVEAAAETYFGTNAQSLTLGQAAFLAGLLEIAHRIGMLVFAEGVERPEELAKVRELGFDGASGSAVR